MAVKAEAIIEKAERLVRLAHIFKLRPVTGVRLDYVTDRFDCSKETARSYIDALEELGFLIEEVTGDFESPVFRLVKEIPDKFPDGIKVSCDTLIPFYYLSKIAPEIEGTFLKELTDQAFSFLEPFFEGSNMVLASKTYKQIGDMDEFINRVRRLFIDLRGLRVAGLSKVNEHLKTVIHAALKQKECKLKYKSLHYKKNLDLVIQPLHIFRVRDLLSVLAIDVTRRRGEHFPRSFVIKRILNVEELETSFEYPKDFDLKNIMSGRDRPGTQMLNPDFISVHLWINAEIADYVCDYQWGSNQIIEKMTNDEGKQGIRLMFDAPNNFELRSWILGLGAKAKVIRPFELGRQISNLALQTLEANLPKDQTLIATFERLKRSLAEGGHTEE